MRPVVIAELENIFARADLVVVTENPLVGARILFESRDAADLRELAESLVLEVSPDMMHCMCIGAPAVHLFGGDRKLAQITNHHSSSIRCSLWSSDVPLADPSKWLRWFEARGILGPSQEAKRMEDQNRATQADWRRWMAGMPPEIEPVWVESLHPSGTVNIPLLRDAFEASGSSVPDRILALLEWYGSGAGPWSGFWSYEIAAEQLLLGYPTVAIVSTLNVATLSASQREGAARLLAGSDFRERHADPAVQISRELKQTLWEHVRSTPDKDKFSRAERAFSPDAPESDSA